MYNLGEALHLEWKYLNWNIWTEIFQQNLERVDLQFALKREMAHSSAPSQVWMPNTFLNVQFKWNCTNISPRCNWSGSFKWSI